MLFFVLQGITFHSFPIDQLDPFHRLAPAWTWLQGWQKWNHVGLR